MQLHPDDTVNFPIEKIVRILLKKGVIGLGDMENNKGPEQLRQFREDAKIGDIVAIKEGQTPVALVEITGPALHEPKPNRKFDWFDHRRTVKILSIYDPNDKQHSFLIPQPRGTFSGCKDLGTPTSEVIINWYNRVMETKFKDEVKALLRYKKQIILQGPPGTGKTYLAKEIAKEMCQVKRDIAPAEYLYDWIKNYKETPEDLKRSTQFATLLAAFQAQFPAEGVSKMTKEVYSIGTGSHETFCYWIERALADLGRFSPGQGGTPVYRVFHSKEPNRYETNIDGQNPDEAMVQIAHALDVLVNEEDVSQAINLFRKGLVVKILHSYHPDKYFPIFNQEHIKKVAKLLGLTDLKLDDITLNRRINDRFLQWKTETGSTVDKVRFMGEIYHTFIFGGGVGPVGDDVHFRDAYEIVQFHPSYTYEDFVRGIVVEAGDNGQPKYTVKNKVLARLAESCLSNPGPHVLILDEINRANLSSVLGELIYALEYRYDPAKHTETSVQSMYGILTIDELSGEELEEYSLRLPPNLLIIGTMNTADRSVGHIDYAVRRRFAFVDVLPRPLPDFIPEANSLFHKVASVFCKAWREGTTELENSVHLAADFKPMEVMLGHSYFIAKDKQELEMKWRFEILPILKEYVKDGILLTTAIAKIKEIDGEVVKSH